MGIIKKGILGGFSGKVGNVVGASWKGIDYIRSMPSSVRNPRTEKQVTQRNKFIVIMEFLRPLNVIIREGFKSDAKGKITAMNAAMSVNLMSAVKGEFPNFSIDYANARITRGELYGTSFASANIVGDDLNFTWDITASNNAQASDNVIIVAYNSNRREVVYDLNAVARMEGDALLSIPSHWEGDTVETYLAFQSADGDLISNSFYVGSHEVTAG